MRRTLIVGNWKMNGMAADVAVLEDILRFADPDGPSILICPPATLIARFVARTEGSPVMIGAQDCHAEKSGAHTGDLSAEMLVEAGARAVIVGHSERRAGHGESDRQVRAKAAAVLRANRTPIICVGESESQREAGQAAAVVARQLAASIPDLARAESTIIAYEPVWAIGTGRTPAMEEIAEIHQCARSALQDRFGRDGEQCPVLYGGSVTPENAADILAVAEVGGALVGGASLTADSFLAIVAAAAGH